MTVVLNGHLGPAFRCAMTRGRTTVLAPRITIGSFVGDRPRSRLRIPGHAFKKILNRHLFEHFTHVALVIRRALKWAFPA
jgi:hypothetical protein